MRKIIYVILGVLLTLSGCSDSITGSTDNALPSWLANKTWTGEGTTVITGSKDFYITVLNGIPVENGSTTGIKEAYESQGYTYKEKSTNTEYGLYIDDPSTKITIEDVAYTVYGEDIFMVFTKNSEISLTFTYKGTSYLINDSTGEKSNEVTIDYTFNLTRI